ncbi:TPA: NACHT domain-containing protein, partial [Klebsiella pneumoniae]
MNSTFYLERNFTHGDRTYTETELLAASTHIVVLAEPGGGKTELMKSLAQKLNTSVFNASVFAYVEADKENSPLIIDAVDEVARIDQSGIHKLLALARTSTPTRVIMSSRSSEWGQASTSIFEKFLGFSPMVVRLREFDQNEQHAIFKHHAPEEDFFAFQTEVTRFSLDMLLPNPQFLKMFTDAYLESGRRFADKRSIFALAVERLAKEANPNIPKASVSLSVAQKISFSAEVYAKLLLSGAEGVSTTDATSSRMYPMLSALFSGSTACYDILSTQLFKPGDKEDQHRPVHKIVAEYCAADYLIKRIADPVDVLTLPKCLPVIAPNGTARDELRGLLGWMAALGNKSVQGSIIELDAYAVLANGDPSQLERSSKRQLLHRLKKIEAEDPYFRRSDFWRRFSAAGFFTQDVVEEIKPLLTMSNEGHLRSLILELLADSPVNCHLASELSLLTLNPDESEQIRTLASRCLLDVK